MSRKHNGSLRQLPSGSWELRFYAPGPDGPDGPKKLQSQTIKAPTKTKANEELRRILCDIEAGQHVERTKRNNPKLADYLGEWLQDMEMQVAAGELRIRTLQTYRHWIEQHILPKLGAIRLQSLKVGKLETFYTQLKIDGRRDGKGGLSPQSVKHIHRVLSESLKRAVRRRIINGNPCDQIEAKRLTVTEYEGRALTEAETLRLFEAAKGTALYLPILIAAGTGMRQGEVLGLRWADVDLDAGTVTVRQQVSRPTGDLKLAPPKTKRSRRTFDLPASLVAAMKEHKAAQAEHRLCRLQQGKDYQNQDLILPRADGSLQHPSTLSHAFARLLRQHGLPRVRFHDLRHSHASQLAHQGASPTDVAARLGHSSSIITQKTYTHAFSSAQKRLAQDWDAAMSQAAGSATER